MSIAEIADLTDMKKDNAKQLLHKMKRDGEVITPKQGCYTVPEHRDHPDADYHDNFDNRH